MFDPVAGTVEPIEEYDETDKVATWFATEKEEDLVGKNWDPEYDAEYIRKAIRGWGLLLFQYVAAVILTSKELGLMLNLICLRLIKVTFIMFCFSFHF